MSTPHQTMTSDHAVDHAHDIDRKNVRPIGARWESIGDTAMSPATMSPSGATAWV